MDRTPFTYLIRFLPTGKVYYGSRTAKGCHPSDIGVRYFSSSKTVLDLHARCGAHCFEYEVRKIFESKEKCLEWERRFLTRVDAINNPIFLNRHNGGDRFIGGPKSERTKQKLREARKLQAPISEDTREKIRQAHIGRKHTEQSIALMRKRAYEKTSPGHTGRVFSEQHIVNLKASKIGLVRKPMSLEARAKLSMIRTGKKRGPYKRKPLIEPVLS